jgi:GTP-binding protein HflX
MVDTGNYGDRAEGEQKEKAVLVSVRWGETKPRVAEESLLELRSLAETAGAEVVGMMLQARPRPDPATFIGKGKMAELDEMVSSESADLVIFDQDLSPSQQRNLENELDLKVLDRTALILDIFAMHAHSKEGKAQVEMAQLRYGLTRLTGRGVELSRLGGGIGTRGPGETKLEVDRRRINTRIKTLDRELKDLFRIRKVKRKRRERRDISTFALIGYTNAGKSSLLNALTNASVLVEDQLFSTLDPITRSIDLPANRRAVVTDTVGFINHLPHQLVEAFKSTLEEVKEADVLLHVVDAASPSIKRRIDAVDDVLEELDAGEMRTMYVLNKCDLLQEEERAEIARAYPSGVLTSTLTGEGLEKLLESMSATLATSLIVHVTLPHEEGELLSLLYRRGQVLELAADSRGYHLTAEIPRNLLYRFEAFLRGGKDALEEGEQNPHM